MLRSGTSGGKGGSSPHHLPRSGAPCQAATAPSPGVRLVTSGLPGRRQASAPATPQLLYSSLRGIPTPGVAGAGVFGSPGAPRQDAPPQLGLSGASPALSGGT